MAPEAVAVVVVRHNNITLITIKAYISLRPFSLSFSLLLARMCTVHDATLICVLSEFSDNLF